VVRFLMVQISLTCKGYNASNRVGDSGYRVTAVDDYEALRCTIASVPSFTGPSGIGNWGE